MQVTQPIPCVVVWVGPPCIGKGYNIHRLTELYQKIGGNTYHISPGTLLRESTDPQVRKYVDNGRLVPDQIVSDLVRDAYMSAPQGNTLVNIDGFPRTLNQAEIFGKFLEEGYPRYACVLHLSGSHETCRKRQKIRRKAEQRADDREGTLATRWEEYETHTQAVTKKLLQYRLPYREISAEEDPKDVFSKIWTEIGELITKPPHGCAQTHMFGNPDLASAAA